MTGGKTRLYILHFDVRTARRTTCKNGTYGWLTVGVKNHYPTGRLKKGYIGNAARFRTYSTYLIQY